MLPKQKVAINGKNAKVVPKDASVDFEILSIIKDKKSFTNPKSGGFMIETKGGKLSIPKAHKLSTGTYVLKIVGANRKNKKDKKGVKVTVVIE